MKPHRAFFHTLHVPLLRLMIPFAFLLAFFSIALPLISHKETHSLLPNTGIVVMIDPGHGGYDPGVMSGSIHEADVTLSIGKQLKAELEKRGITARLTRETDTDFAHKGQRGSNAKRTDLNKRIEMTAEQKATVFVSLHANVSSLATRGGAEVFYYEDTPGAKKLADLVQKSLHTLPNMSKRDAKSSKYYLLRNQSIPSLIIECGYLNVAAERQRLLSADYQQKIASAIADGIVTYTQNE